MGLAIPCQGPEVSTLNSPKKIETYKHKYGQKTTQIHKNYGLWGAKASPLPCQIHQE